MSGKAAAAFASMNIPDEARAVAGMMSLPLDYPPVRVADTYSADETALAQVVSKRKVNWDAGLNLAIGTTGRQLPSNDWGAFVFPSLLRHTVTYTILDPGVAAIAWSYSATKGIDLAGTAFSIPSLESTFMFEPGNFTADNTNTVSPHGAVLYCGKAMGRTGFWVDATATMPANLFTEFTPALAAGVLCTVNAYRWGSGRWNLQTSQASGPSAANVGVSVPISGYYAVEYAFSGGQLAVSTFTFKIQEICTSSWAHAPVNDLAQNMASIGNSRILGLAFLLQNEASVMNKQGNVVAFQSPPNADWYGAYASQGVNFYNNVFSDKAATSFLLETGIYGFKRPKGAQDFNFETEIYRGADTTLNSSLNYKPANEIKQAFFSIECPCDYLGIAASASQVGAADCLLSTAVGVEYTTTNSWLETQTPVIAKQAFELGIASLREVEQFYENPIHIPALMDAISSGMSAVAPLVGFIPGFGPALAGGAAMGGQIVRQVKNAIYGETSNDSQEQGANRAQKKNQKNAQRLAELETVVNNGRYARRTRRRMG